MNLEGMRRINGLLRRADEAIDGARIDEARTYAAAARADPDLEPGLLPEGLFGHVLGRLVAIDERLSHLGRSVVDSFANIELGVMAEALHAAVSASRRSPVTIEADVLAVRAVLEGAANGYGVLLFSKQEPFLRGFRCECHGDAATTASDGSPVGPVIVTRVSSACLFAVVSGICSMLSNAGLGPAAWPDIVAISGDAKARQALADHGVLKMYRRHVHDWDLERATHVTSRADLLASVSRDSVTDALAPTRSRSARSEPGLPKWRGFPVPPVCRALECAILAHVDETGPIDPLVLGQWAVGHLCVKHPATGLDELLADKEMFRADTEGLWLTVKGGLRSDRLLGGSRSLKLRTVGPAQPGMYLWQQEALQAWADHGRVGVVEAVTGTGKTRVGVEAIRDGLADGFKVVICVPSLVLRDQWLNVLRAHGVRRVGALGGGANDKLDRHDVIVATVQTLRKRNLLRSVDKAMLVVDECHRVGAPTFQDALASEYQRRLGLTATFERADDNLKDLQAFFEGDPVFEIAYERAVPEGIVAQYVVARVGVDFTLEEHAAYQAADEACRSNRGTLLAAGVPGEPFGVFMNAAAALAADDGDPLSKAARSYLEAFSRRAAALSEASGKVSALASLASVVRDASGALVFTMLRKSAALAAEVLRAHEVKAVAIDGQSSPDERAAALDGLRAGILDAVVAPRILDEGVDVPDVDLGIILATSTRRTQMIQRMGRVLRLKKDGRRARFVLFYVRDTAEDPRGPGGAHEAFFDAIVPTADAVADFEIGQVAELGQFLQHPDNAPSMD